MSQNWAEALLFICVVAQFFCVTASVTSASRMIFAFSRDRAVPGHRSGGTSRRTASRGGRCSASGCSRRILMIPAVWNFFVGYAVGTAIAVIGLYVAFILPVWLRWRKGDTWDEPRAWSLGKHYKWIDPLSVLWVAFITIIFILPLYKSAFPGRTTSTGRFTNYTILVVRRHRPDLRRLVGPLGPQVVQGPGPHGHRGGARADRGGPTKPGSGPPASSSRTRVGARASARAPTAPLATAASVAPWRRIEPAVATRTIPSTRAAPSSPSSAGKAASRSGTAPFSPPQATRRRSPIVRPLPIVPAKATGGRTIKASATIRPTP